MLNFVGLSSAQTIDWKTLCLHSSEQVFFGGRLNAVNGGLGPAFHML